MSQEQFLLKLKIPSAPETVSLQCSAHEKPQWCHAASVLTNRWWGAAAAGWLLDLQPLWWWWWQLWQGADDRREEERIHPWGIVPHLDQWRTAAGLSTAGGLHHSYGPMVHWARSELRFDKAWRPWGETWLQLVRLDQVRYHLGTPEMHGGMDWFYPGWVRGLIHGLCNKDKQYLCIISVSAAPLWWEELHQPFQIWETHGT